MKRKLSIRDAWARLDGLKARLSPRARRRLPVIGCFLLGGVIAFATCGGCGRRPNHGEVAAPQTSASAAPRAVEAETGATGAIENPLLWQNATDGDVEDLTTLAVEEGAGHLVEVAKTHKELRPTAIRAMAYAYGWAQLPFLAEVAGAKDNDEATLALGSAFDIAARPRRSEDVEDVDELREGCEALGALARDGSRPKPRRLGAIRTLRMLPCPKMDVPTELDAK